jgi:large subunit ribosomal protein L25
MANDKPTLAAETREVTGKKVKRLRGRGKLPAVIYGKGFESRHIVVPTKEFRRLYHEVGGNTLVRLQLEEGEENVLIHEPDRNPINGEEFHVDFYRVNMNEKITTEVPLRFTGEAPAVRALDGTLIRPLDAVLVECLPGNLPSDFEVNLDSLEDFEASVHVRDIAVPEGVEILTDADELVARVEPPRSEEELEELEDTSTVGEEAEDAALSEVEAEEGEVGEEDEEATPEAQE